MVPESAPGLAVDWAWTTITAHAEGRDCAGCRDVWCPTAEWALWVVITDRIVPADRRQLVTVVARQVMTAHWPRTVDGCRPCGLPDCGRIQLAGTWLEVVGDEAVPDSVQILRSTPTDAELRRITGIGARTEIDRATIAHLPAAPEGTASMPIDASSAAPENRAETGSAGPELTSREIRLAARPHGEPGPENFELASTTVPAPGPGQILVRNTWMSVDPYMRGRMDDRKSYIAPFRVGATLDGGAVGEVVASEAPSAPVGATVSHFLGWREYAVLDATTATVLDTGLAPAEAYLGVLGTPGLTAYVALTDTAPVRPGDVVFVSAAAGAVGSVAGQFARKLGASRVVGSAGGPEKARRLVAEFGYDAAIDYRAGSVAEQLAAAAPRGIDVYLDNVGGDHLAAALGALRRGGRVALVGAISGYNATAPVPGPANLVLAIGKRLSLRGMLVTDHLDQLAEYLPRAAGWLADGSLRTASTVREGIEAAPGAFLEMLRGGNIGKMLVRL